MRSFKEHALDEMAAPTPGAAELIATFVATDKGARGAFIKAAQEKLGMKSTTAGAYWQRNKHLAGGNGKASAVKSKKDQLGDMLTQEGWSQRTSTNWERGGFDVAVIKDNNRGLTGHVKGPSGNIKRFADDTPLYASSVVRNFVQKEEKNANRAKDVPPAPKAKSLSTFANKVNDRVKAGQDSSGNRVYGGVVSGRSTVNGNGQVGVGGANYRYRGVGAVARWQWGPELSIGVRVFESGHGHITGEKAAQEITSTAIANKYIKAAEDLAGVQGIEPSDIKSVVSMIKTELNKYNEKQAAKKGATGDLELAMKQVYQSRNWLNNLSDQLTKLPIEQFERRDIRYRINKVQEEIDSIGDMIKREVQV